ncbi:MAG: tetratricopeptide repeat protein, partial [Actinomycetota bacterium]|nr:tetratricopeptide repeat protein [Actinomycetota bacterium]
GLVSLNPASPVRTVRMHPCVQAAVRAYLPGPDLEPTIAAAADALLQAWPESAGPAPLVQALRDCTAALRTVQVGMLWQGQAHPLLFRAGISLQDSGLTASAVSYWQNMLVTSSRMFGSGHADAVLARDRLAAAYESAGHFGDAIALFQGALTVRERGQGYEHPDTIAARGRLAHAYASAGRPAEATELYEQVIGAASRQLGPGHPVTLTARANLASTYLAAGQDAESIAAYQLLLTDSERILGPDHPMTVTVRENLDHART